MRSLRFVAIVIAIQTALISSSCGGDPPDREIQQARGAIDAARAAGADRYATGELKAAEEALARAHDAVAQRDYRLALNHALDSREQAQNAAKLAADGKALARVDADRALSALTSALTAAKAALKAAEPSRGSAKTVATARQVIADGEKRVQEARSAFELDDYAVVVSIASAVTPALAGAKTDLGEKAAASSRRRR